MYLLRLFLYAFGGLFLLCLITLGRQVAAKHLKSGEWRRTLRGSIEGWILLGTAVVMAVHYVSALPSAGNMPQIDRRWLLTYGTFCAAYLAVKAIRLARSYK